MQVLDIWSLITGIASLMSLFLAAGERFANWRKYILPFAAALGGFALGRISPAVSSGMNQLSGNPELTGFIILSSTVIVAITLMSYFLIRHGKAWYGYCLCFMGMVYIVLNVIPMYPKLLNIVPPGDLIKLAQLKIDVEEYEQAIKYLEVAREKTKNDVMKKELKDQIDSIMKEATKVSFKGQTM